MSGDIEIYRKQGLGRRMGFGKRPAMLIIDFINGFNNPALLGGGNISDAIDRTEELLAVARHLDLPIAYTTHIYAADGSDDGLFNLKMAGMGDLLAEGSHEVRIVDQLEPRPGERIVKKHYPSAFFGTDLAGWLTSKEVDTAIVTGCTTSGCVRATAVDAMGYGFRPMVPRDCVGDRAAAAHAFTLFDIQARFADVVSLDKTLDYIAGL